MQAPAPLENHNPASPGQPPILLPAGYRFLGSSGFGGFGILAKVEETSTGRVMALKLPHSITMLDPSRIKRFRREIELHSRLDLPGVAKVVARSLDDAFPYLGLEHYPLGNLARWLESKGEPLPVLEAAGTGFQLAATVAGLHAQEIIHRDIRPENLLVFQESPLEVHLTDFGLAFGPDDPGGLTRLADSDGFIAPEVTGALAHPACTGSDVWSLGMILAYLAYGPAGYLEPLRPGCHPPLETRDARRLLDCILHATANHPRDRYQSARELASDLEMLLGGNAPTQAVRHAAKCRRKRLTRRAAIAFGVAGLAILGPRWLLPPATRAKPVPAPKREALENAREIMAAARSGKPEKARELLALHQVELDRVPFLAKAARRAAEPSRFLLDWPGGQLPEIYHARFSPDGRILAAACKDGALRTWTWPERKPLYRSQEVGSEINMVFFSPDGATMCSIADDGFARVHDTRDGGRLVRRVKASGAALTAGCVHGNTLFVGDTDGGISRVDPVAGSVDWTVKVGVGGVESVATNGAGTILAAGLVNGLVALLDTRTSAVTGRFKLVPDIRCVEWIGNAIAVAGSARKVGLYDGSGNGPMWSWENGAHETRSISTVSREGEKPLVAAGADPGRVVLLDAANGRIEGEYLGAPELVRHVCPTPDGGHLVAVGRNGPPTIFNAESSQETRSWPHPGGSWVDAAWKDDATVAAIDTNGTVWHLTADKAIAQETRARPSPGAMPVAFSPGGPVLWKHGDDIILSTAANRQATLFQAGSHLGGIHIDQEICAVAARGKLAIATAADGFKSFRVIPLTEENLETVKIVRDGSTLVVTCHDSATLYNIPTMVEIGRFPGMNPFGPLCAHVCAPGCLLIGTRGGTVLFLDLKTRSIRSSNQVSPRPVCAITSHEPSGLLVTASAEGQVLTHGLGAKAAGPDWNLPGSPLISKMAVSPAGENLMAMGLSGQRSMITLWA